jgi:hypothetical protein
MGFFGLSLPFWMAWVIGGLLCGVTNVVFEVLDDGEKKRS